MKINPENFIVDEGLCLNYKSLFISGNDEAYIFSLVDLLVKIFSKKGFVKRVIVEGVGTAPDLFNVENKYLYISENYIGDNSVKEIESNKDVYIFYEKSSSKNKVIKQFFSKSKDRALIECYELDPNRKKIILNSFIKKHNLVFENNVYWFMLDLLDNRFSILNKELDKILLLDNKNDFVVLSNTLNKSHSTEVNKFYFKIHLNRAGITAFLNSSINSLSDFYSCFSYFKIYSLILFSSKNSVDLEAKIPKYLFREKQSLINLFDSLNENKKKLLSSLLYKTENLVRKNPNLYKPLFYRFVLNYKKIIS
tara:strand:+ start:182 stop:1108 length:927 start_codon:yes stop_codon:yes gene_type:complete